MTWGWLTCFRRLNSDWRSRSSLLEAFSEIQGKPRIAKGCWIHPEAYAYLSAPADQVSLCPKDTLQAFLSGQLLER